MWSRRRDRFVAFCLCAVVLTAPGPGWAQDVLAVISAELEPYQEALSGFKTAFADPLHETVLSKQKLRVSRQIRAVVSFGGKAAQLDYPDDVVLVYLVAPGTRIQRRSPPGTTIQIPMLPHPRASLARLRRLQPDLRRLLVFWATDTLEPYVRELEREAAGVRIEIIARRLTDAEEIPDQVRSHFGKIDAVWLLPDPLLVTPASFAVLKDFSWANRVPFIAPTPGLVEKGATAAVVSSYHEMGKTAATALKQSLAGDNSSDTIYPDKVELTVNLKAAARVGIAITAETLKSIDRAIE